jgi:hypothetical protein
MKKTTFLVVLLTGLAVASCIKETYDMNRLSEKMRLSPAFAISAARGSVTLADIVKANDTITFDGENLMKFYIRKDSVVDIRLDSLLDFTEVFSFSDSYPVGEVKVNNASASHMLTLNQLSLKLAPAIRAELISLDDGFEHIFPDFPTSGTVDFTFPSFTNFRYAVFSAGQLSIVVMNNFPVAISGMRITLRNSDNNAVIGAMIIIPELGAGESFTSIINLEGVRLFSDIKASVIVEGSPGSSIPVIVSMSDDISIQLSGTGLEIMSGRVIIPDQSLGEPDAVEMVSFDPGDGMEITELSLNNGTINYSVVSQVGVTARLRITLPTVTRNIDDIFSELINVNPSSVTTGSFSATNLMANLSNNPAQRYNSLPAKYEVDISSNGSFVNFSSSDAISFNTSISGLNINYIKGYFGQRSEAFDPDTIDLGIDDILERIDGELYIANPVLRLDYRNSFALPVEITLNATGSRGTKTESLDMDPFILGYPVFPIRDKADTWTVDRSNSSLPALISLPPASIIVSGAAKLNPAGNTGRNNYVFGDSRFVASLEAEVPVDLWIKNLLFADTLDNFLKGDGEDEGFSPEDLNYVRLDLSVSNGFPLGVSVKIVLHDSVAVSDIYTLDVPGLIEPAPVNSDGRATSATEKKTEIVLDESFFEAAGKADRMILIFTLNTTGSGPQSVKIYSDYTISFTAGLVIRPNIILN